MFTDQTNRCHGTTIFEAEAYRSPHEDEVEREFSNPIRLLEESKQPTI